MHKLRSMTAATVDLIDYDDVLATFDPVLGYLKARGVWAVSWGLVAGRSQTIFPWDSWSVTHSLLINAG